MWAKSETETQIPSLTLPIELTTILLRKNTKDLILWTIFILLL
jgi:hypothetical protein